MSRCIPDNKRKTSCVVLLRKINWDNFINLHRLIVLDKKKKKRTSGRESLETNSDLVLIHNGQSMAEALVFFQDIVSYCCYDD